MSWTNLHPKLLPCTDLGKQGLHVREEGTSSQAAIRLEVPQRVDVTPNPAGNGGRFCGSLCESDRGCRAPLPQSATAAAFPHTR
jgi:hypothetical protein